MDAETIERIALEMAQVAFKETIELPIRWTDVYGRTHDKVVGRPVAMYAMRGVSAHSNGFQSCRALHLIQMLLGALRTLDGSTSSLVVPAFFWKVLALEGYRPEVDVCVLCGDDGPLVAFDLPSGGLLCHGCRRGSAVSPEAVELLRWILGGQLNEALALDQSPAHVEVDHLATRAVEHHLERRLRSVTVLDH